MWPLGIGISIFLIAAGLLVAYESARSLDRYLHRKRFLRLLAHREILEGSGTSLDLLLKIVGQFLNCNSNKLRGRDRFGIELRLQSKFFDWVEGSAWNDFEIYIREHYSELLQRDFCDKFSVEELVMHEGYGDAQQP
jgi:hypothetical protein